jgi:phosphoglycolate phosphatase-like HAD superfamily hydrolase
LIVGVSEYRSAVFDCDGVILVSNQIKTEAFRAALDGEAPQLVAAFVEYHRRHGGISRYVKFRHFYEVMKPSADATRLASEAIERYALSVRAGLERAALVPGVLAMLDWFADRRVPCYVLSGGDEQEVRDVLALRGLQRYFAGIYGSPRTKPDILRLLRDESRLPAPGVFFGDARADMDAAAAYGLDFCLLYGYSDWSGGVEACRQHGHPCNRDFDEFLAAHIARA